MRMATPPPGTCSVPYPTCSSQLNPGTRLSAYSCGHTPRGFVAWQVARIQAAFHSALRGGLIFASYGLRFARRQGWVSLELSTDRRRRTTAPPRVKSSTSTLFADKQLAYVLTAIGFAYTVDGVDFDEVSFVQSFASNTGLRPDDPVEVE